LRTQLALTRITDGQTDRQADRQTLGHTDRKAISIANRSRVGCAHKLTTVSK